jgi:hypothetical protein
MDLKRLCQELDVFIKKGDCEDKLKIYTKTNLKILNGNDRLIIKSKNLTYEVGIIFEDDGYYWLLKPYKDSYFTTPSRLWGNFSMILQAIKDNEELYM